MSSVSYADDFESYREDFIKTSKWFTGRLRNDFFLCSGKGSCPIAVNLRLCEAYSLKIINYPGEDSKIDPSLNRPCLGHGLSLSFRSFLYRCRKPVRLITKRIVPFCWSTAVNQITDGRRPNG
jgi:hypothetical protein